MDYIKDMQIDESALDVELLNQPKLAFKYGKYWAELSYEYDVLEESLSVVKAELNAQINENPEMYLGGAKATVANVESAILRNEQYKEIQQELFTLRKEVAIAKIAYNEISNARKTSLQNLVQLNQMHYFASPNVPRDLTNEVAKLKLQQESNKKVRIQRNNK